MYVCKTWCKYADVFLHVLLCVAVCCSVLQCVAVCCSVLQSIAVYCSLVPVYLKNNTSDDDCVYYRVCITLGALKRSNEGALDLLHLRSVEKCWEGIANPTWGDIFESSKLKAQSSNVSFATFQWKETFELWALSFETAFENVTASGIGCIWGFGLHVRGRMTAICGTGWMGLSMCLVGWQGRRAWDCARLLKLLCRPTWSFGSCVSLPAALSFVTDWC